MLSSKKLSLLAGGLCGFAFAPVFFLPGIFATSFLGAQTANSKTIKNAMAHGYLFALGLYLTTIYWMSIGISVYAKEFWWAIPFALFGLPAFIAIFYTILTAFSWHFRKSVFFHFIFCISWIYVEWLISWIFTGLPWSLIGYTLSISDILIQASSIFGIMGLSFLTIYIGSSFYSYNGLRSRIIVSVIMVVSLISYGLKRLESNPTEFNNINVRIVQPSIPQTDKWLADIFWQNLYKQIDLSNQEGEPDLIIWSEAALTVPYYHIPVQEALRYAFTNDQQILLIGGVNDNQKEGENYEVYSSFIALDSSMNLQFDYHKSHLVPFGEYIPFSKYLPLTKITHGVIDYTPGKREVLYLEKLNLRLQPLICYESIFTKEVRITNDEADLIVNITNDAWYGNSSGPYQHFEISKMRAIENGLPMLRAGNNGISAIIDPYGRVLKSLQLNEVNVIDGKMPLKILNSTIYSQFGIKSFFILATITLILQLTILILYSWLTKLKKNL